MSASAGENDSVDMENTIEQAGLNSGRSSDVESTAGQLKIDEGMMPDVYNDKYRTLFGQIRSQCDQLKRKLGKKDAELAKKDEEIAKMDVELASCRQTLAVMEAKNAALVNNAMRVNRDTEVMFNKCRQFMNNLVEIHAVASGSDVTDQDGLDLWGATIHCKDCVHPAVSRETVRQIQHRVGKLMEGSYKPISFQQRMGCDDEFLQQHSFTEEEFREMGELSRKLKDGFGEFKVLGAEAEVEKIDKDNYAVYQYNMLKGSCAFCRFNGAAEVELSDHLLIEHAGIQDGSTRDLYVAQYTRKLGRPLRVTPFLLTLPAKIKVEDISKSDDEGEETESVSTTRETGFVEGSAAGGENRRSAREGNGTVLNERPVVTVGTDEGRVSVRGGSSSKVSSVSAQTLKDKGRGRSGNRLLLTPYPRFSDKSWLKSTKGFGSPRSVERRHNSSSADDVEDTGSPQRELLNQTVCLSSGGSDVVVLGNSKITTPDKRDGRGGILVGVNADSSTEQGRLESKTRDKRSYCDSDVEINEPGVDQDKTGGVVASKKACGENIKTKVSEDTARFEGMTEKFRTRKGEKKGTLIATSISRGEDRKSQTKQRGGLQYGDDYSTEDDVDPKTIATTKKSWVSKGSVDTVKDKLSSTAREYNLLSKMSLVPLPSSTKELFGGPRKEKDGSGRDSADSKGRAGVGGRSGRDEGRKKFPLKAEERVQAGASKSSDIRRLKPQRYRFVKVDARDFNDVPDPSGNTIYIPRKSSTAVQYVLYLADCGLDCTQQYFEWQERVKQQPKSEVERRDKTLVTSTESDTEAM